MPPTPARFACLALALAAALAACETPASYQPAPVQGVATGAVAQRPSFTPGDEFWFHIGGTAILVEVYEGMEDGLHAFRRGMQNETVYYSPDLAQVKVDLTFGDDTFFEPDNGELAFPLAVGKTWSRKYRVRTSTTVFETELTRDCEVLDLGQLNFQAGLVAVYRIACSVRELGQAELIQEEVLYAPAIGRIVLSRNLGGGTDLSLIEYTRAE